MHAFGEPADGLFVVRRGLKRLGEEGDGPHRGLQFMGHVGHEVVADLFGPGDFGPVVGQQEDVFLTEHGRTNLHDDGPLAKRMHKESGRLAALVQDIIELSRLQGASVAQQGRPVDINAVISEAVDRSQLPAESKNIKIVVGGHADGMVYGDPDLLVTALRNLIDNAIRYSPENTRVGVGVRAKEGLIAISVTDQGEGLSPEDQERVFERFYRVDAARSRHTGGTGLGLSIVKHVVSNHGGEVTLWSQPGHGSTFTLRLPEMEGPDVEEEPAAGPKSAPPKHHSARQSHESRAAGAHEQGASA